MTPHELRAIKKQVMQLYQRYSSASVIGMVMDCQAYLGQSALLRPIRSPRQSDKTGGPMTQFALHCEPIVPTTSSEDLGAELERIWLNDLCFTNEAHTLERPDGNLILDFITWWPRSDGFYVTGAIVLALPTAPPAP